MIRNTGTPLDSRKDAPATAESPGVSAHRPADAYATTLGCLREDEILAYREGQTSEQERTRIHAHLDVCTACNDLLHLVLADFAASSGTVAGGISHWPKAFSPGTVLAGRYRVERFVGQGGMGEVYEAADMLLNTRVAVKTVLSTVSDNQRAARKLFDEVRNAQRVTHSHVCRINELHTHPGTEPNTAPVHFLTMEFVDGERLGTRLRRAALPLHAVRELAQQLLDGLRAAHAKGIAHLDFKSDNIMLRSGPALEAVIMDFGLSRVLDPEARMRTSERLQLAGTLRYMAPEQLECRPDIGPAADVYAFGVVLYELLTGKLPFDGASLSSILLKQLKQKPAPPSRELPALSAAVDEFVLACLTPARAERFADAGVALTAFERVGDWQSPRPSRHWRHAIVVCALFAAALGGAARYAYTERASVSASRTSADARTGAAQTVEALAPSSVLLPELQGAAPAVPLAVPLNAPAVSPRASAPSRERVASRRKPGPRASPVRSDSSPTLGTEAAAPLEAAPLEDLQRPPELTPSPPEPARDPNGPERATLGRRSKLPGAPERFLEVDGAR